MKFEKKNQLHKRIKKKIGIKIMRMKIEIKNKLKGNYNLFIKWLN
jgi:hypothetical protein